VNKKITKTNYRETGIGQLFSRCQGFFFRKVVLSFIRYDKKNFKDTQENHKIKTKVTKTQKFTEQCKRKKNSR